MPMLKGISENLAQSVEHLHQQQLLKANKLIAEEGNKENLEILLDSQFSIIKEIEKFSVSQQKVLLLSGDDFSGKTLLTQQLLLRLLHSSNAWQMLPIYIDLDNLIDIKQPIIDKYLEETYKLTAENLNELKKQDKTIFIFDHYGNKGVCVNLYVTQQLSTWNGKSIIVSDKKYLSKYSDYKPCFIPYQNQRRQIELYAELISPASSMDISKESPDKEIDQNYSTSEVKTSILQNTVNQSFKNRSLQISYQPESNKSTSDYEELLSHPLNERLSTHDINVMRHLASQVQKDPSFKKALYELIFASRDESRLSRAAANAITALNYAKASLSGIDFSGCDITGADLRGAILDHANFSGANLTNVDLQGACIRKTNFSGAKMYGVNFGEKPYIKLSQKIIKLQLLIDESLLSVVYGKDTNTVNIYHNTTKTPVCVEGFLENTDLFKKIYISADGIIAAVVEFGIHNRIHLLEIYSGTRIKTFTLPEAQVKIITLSHDNQLLAAASADNMYVFDINTGEIFTCDYLMEEIEILSLSFCYNNKLLASLHYDTKTTVCHLWEVQTISKKLLHKFLLCDNAITKIDKSINTLSSRYSCAMSVYSYDNNYLITCYENVKVWSLITSKLIYEIKTRDNIIPNHIALSPDNRYLAVGYGRDITLYNFEYGKRLCSLEGHEEDIISLMFDTNVNRLISADKKGFIRFWECIIFDEKQFIKEEKTSVNLAVVSPDSKFLAIVNHGKLIIWVIAKWLKLCTIDIDKWGITHLSFHSNSQSLAMSGKFSHAIHIFDIKDYVTTRNINIQHYSGDYHVKDFIDCNTVFEVNGSQQFISVASHKFKSENQAALITNDADENVIHVIGQVINTYGYVNLVPDYDIKGIAFNEKYLISTNSDGSFHIWDLEVPKNKWPDICSCSYKTNIGHELYLEGETVFQMVVKCEQVASNIIGYIPSQRQFIIVKSSSNDSRYNTNEMLIFDPSDRDSQRILGKRIALDIFNKTALSSNALPIIDFVICNNKHFFYIAYKKKLFLYDGDTHLECNLNNKYDRDITCIAISPCDRYISLGFSDNTVEILSHQYGANMHLEFTIYEMKGSILRVSWGEDEQGLFFFVNSSRDNIARCWRLMNNGGQLDAMLCWSTTQNSLEASQANITNVVGLSEDDHILLSQHGAQHNPVANKELLPSGHDGFGLFGSSELSCRNLGVFSSSKKLKLSPMSYSIPFFWWDTKNDEDAEIMRIRRESSKAAKRFQQGNQAIIENELDKAIRFYQRAIDINDKIAVFHQQLAYCYWLKALREKNDNYFHEVSESLKTALKIEANAKLYVFCTLYLFQNKSFYDEALLYLDKAVNTILKNSNYSLYFKSDNKILLPPELQTQIDGTKRSAIDVILLAYYLFIQIYFSLSDRDNANKYLHIFINEISKRPAAMSYALLGFCHKLLGNYAEAAYSFVHVKELDNSHPLAKENSRECFALAGIDIPVEAESVQTSSGVHQDDEDKHLQQAIALSMRI